MDSDKTIYQMYSLERDLSMAYDAISLRNKHLETLVDQLFDKLTARLPVEEVKRLLGPLIDSLK